MHIGRTANLAVTVLATILVGTSYLSPAIRTAEGAKSVLAAEVQSPEQGGEPSNVIPEKYTGSFRFTDVTTMLGAQGVTVYPEDKVYAFPPPEYGLGSSEIKVYRAQPVVVTIAGEESLLRRTWAPTVKDFLDSAGVEVGEKDLVVPPVDTPIAHGSQPLGISITRVAETDIDIDKPVAFVTTYKDNPDLEKGTLNTLQEGKIGSQRFTYHVRRENGKEVSRVLVMQVVTVQPQDKVVERGTKVVALDSGKASWYDAPSMTAAHKTLPKGTKVKVTNTATGASVIVTIADRGPYVAGRVIDLSRDAFAAIGSIGSGVINVRVEVP